MNKRLIASLGCTILLASSAAQVVQARSFTDFTSVDAIATASTTTTTTTPSTSTSTTPSTSTSKPSTSTSTSTTKPSTNNNTVSMEKSSKISRLLAIGSVGGDVKYLQELLNNNGYSLKVDGIFGEKTLAAVKGYQGKNKLTVDGIVGPKTLAKIVPVEVAVVEPTKPVEETKPVEPTTPVDVTTGASKVYTVEDLQKVASAEGTWIVCFEANLETDKDIVVEGEILNGKGVVQRKVALYNYVEGTTTKETKEEFTLKAPRIIINSTNARIQKGTFIGDVYVNAKDFQLVDTNIIGNVYFANAEVKESFKIDELSTVSGVQEVIVADVTTSASLTADSETFISSFGKEGSWIISALGDITTDKPVVLEGALYGTKGKADRKIALYTQDANKTVLEEFTFKAPSLTINSPNARLENGTFIGDIFVNVNNFTIKNTEVIGNVYFANEHVKSTFILNNGTISGTQEVIVADASTSASLTADSETFISSFGKDGSWIISALGDITTDKAVVLEGALYGTKGKADRKIALYTQDANKNVLEEFTFKARSLTINSPNARLENGTFIGDIFVNVNNFTIKNTEVIGNVYFANENVKSTFKLNNGTISGVQEVIVADASTSASLTADSKTFVSSFGKDGSWIISALGDITTDKPVVLEGALYGTKGKADRKIALYTQDANKTVLDQFTFTAPSLTINSPNARLENGTFVGDIYVNVNNFTIKNTKVIGNVYFANEHVKSTFVLNNGTISGVQEVK